MSVRLVLAFVVAPLLAVGFAEGAAAQVSDPPVVIDSFERARGQRDVDAALAHFADDAVVRIVDRRTLAFNGKPEIRHFLQNVEIGTPPQLTSNRHVVGNTVSWSERTSGQLLNAIDLAVEVVVQDGKIRSLVYRVATPPTGDAAAAEGPARMPAATALAGLLGLGLVLLAVASFGSRRTASESRLRGKLVSGLGAFRSGG